MKVLSVVGARPNFMKIAPIVKAIAEHNYDVRGYKTKMDHLLIHTGQHYDFAMSESFFGDLNLPAPDAYLGVGSNSHATQTAEIMTRVERILLEQRPDVVIVVGDVNSTMAAALVASKISYTAKGGRPKIAHVEAGLRSFDRTMPEEINRIVTDSLSDFLFVTEQSAIDNLRHEGVQEERIHFVGNTMIDTLLAFRDKALDRPVLRTLGLLTSCGEPLPYALLTLHRPSNVDDKDTFVDILRALEQIAKELPIVFPAHPRTQKQFSRFGLDGFFRLLETESDSLEERFLMEQGINVVPPFPYTDFLCLMANAKIVLTDSGGIQEETTCLGVPCVTIRDNTERPVTIAEGTNRLAGTTTDGIVRTFRMQIGRNVGHSSPRYWDGKAANRIVQVLVDQLQPL